MKQVLSILKGVGVVVGFSATLWGVFSLVDAIQDSQAQNLENHEVVLNRLQKIETNIDSLYLVEQKRDRSEDQIKTMIRQTEGRLLYYIKHSEQMTNEQILDAFELGLETGKKKDLTVSERRETPWGIVETVYD